MVHEAVRAAEMLQEEGWEIEVVDLRSVKPLDTDTVMASVGFHLLDAPPMRLNAKDTPIPYHPKLWAAHRPTPESIKHALKELLAY